MLFIENVKLALTAIRSNKMRSFLTMLGIIIGISSVIAITSIGDSAKGAVNEEFEGIGAGYLYIYPNYEMIEDYISSDAFFTTEELEAFHNRFSDEVLYVAPYRSLSGTAKLGRTDAKFNLYGVGANYDDFYKLITMKYGRMLNTRDIEGVKNNIVIDEKAAKKLFGREDVVGEKINVETYLGSIDYSIIGVYSQKETISSSLSFGETTYSCYIPYTAASYDPDEPATYIETYIRPDLDPTITSEKYCRWLEKLKNQEEGFYTVETAQSALNQVNSILGTLSLAIGAIAAISLLVGGIGIMNIMLVSVTERTREIGIRKSLGARTKDILTQFLIEAMILSVIGGVIGTALGVGIAAIGMTIAKVGLVINPLTIIVAVLFSAGVGLLFGVFPARKAARLDPIEALRYE